MIEINNEHLDMVSAGALPVVAVWVIRAIILEAVTHVPHAH